MNLRKTERLAIHKETHFLYLALLSIFLSGDYLVTIEEKNSATYLRAYTNWRYQVHS